MKRLLAFLLTIPFFPLVSQNLQWVNAIGSSSGDQAYSVALDGAGNVYTAGYFNGVVDFDSGPGTYTLNSANTNSASVFIRKTDPNGNLIWVKQLASVTSWTIYPVTVTIDKWNDIYIAGHFWDLVDFDPGPSSHTIYAPYHCDFVLKLNASGNFLWAKRLNDNCGLAFDVTTDDVGNVYTSGTFSDVNDFDPSPATYTLDGGNYYDAYVSKLDSSGNFVWAVRLGGTDMDAAYALKTDKFGNVYTTGYFKSVNADFDPGPATYSMVAPNSNEDVFITKLSPQGTLIWAKQITGPQNQTSCDLTLDQSANIILTGLFMGNTDFDPGSNAYTLTPNPQSTGQYETFITKLDSLGNLIWAKQFLTSDYSSGVSVTTDDRDNVITTGYIFGSTDFDPGPGTYSLVSAGAEDVFISKLDSAGNFMCAFVLGGPSYDKGFSVQTDAQENIYLAGEFRNITDFDPGASVNTAVSNGDYDAFSAKFNSCFISVNTKNNALDLTYSVYPNPGHDVINIQFASQSVEKREVILLNVLGEEIYHSGPFEEKQLTIDVRKYVRGFYSLDIRALEGRQLKKIVLE